MRKILLKIRKIIASLLIICLFVGLIFNLINLLINRCSLGNEDCWICRNQFNNRTSKNLYLLEMSSLAMFEVDAIRNDLSQTRVSLDNSIVTYTKQYTDRWYTIMRISLDSMDSLLTSAEDATESLCDNCLMKLGYEDGITQEIPNYIFIDYATGSFYSLPEGDGHAVVGDYMVIHYISGDEVKISIIYSPEY